MFPNWFKVSFHSVRVMFRDLNIFMMEGMDLPVFSKSGLWYLSPRAISYLSRVLIDSPILLKQDKVAGQIPLSQRHGFKGSRCGIIPVIVVSIPFSML